MPEPPLDIGPLSEADLGQLIVLQAELLDEAADLARMRTLWAVIDRDPNHLLLGAKEGERLVGSLAGIVCPDLIGSCIPFMVIENVIVAKDRWRRGVGRQLMLAVERFARARDCRYLMLVSARSREWAPAFYHSLGYGSAPYRGFKKMLKD